MRRIENTIHAMFMAQPKRISIRAVPGCLWSYLNLGNGHGCGGYEEGEMR